MLIKARDGYSKSDLCSAEGQGMGSIPGDSKYSSYIKEYIKKGMECHLCAILIEYCK